jgi:hypothetical protein
MFTLHLAAHAALNPPTQMLSQAVLPQYGSTAMTLVAQGSKGGGNGFENTLQYIGYPVDVAVIILVADDVLGLVVDLAENTFPLLEAAKLTRYI